MVKPVATLLLCLALAFSPPAAPRVVAVGDIHGDFDAFAAILQRAALLDTNRHWSGRDATLVQTGDFLDRGPKSRAVMDLLMRLQKEASRQGGRVLVLLGNHEAMNMFGDLRYVTESDYASYVDDKSESRRKASGASVPLGFVEHREAFGPGGKYGKWLRSLPAIVKVNETIFLHGGLKVDFASWKVDQINEAVAAEVKLFDASRKYMIDQKLATALSTLKELADAANAAGLDANHKKALEPFLRYGSWLTINTDGPLWFRGFAQWSDAEGNATIRQLASAFGVKRFVVGHTPQEGTIVPRFDGQVVLIDTGMLSSTFAGGRASALEILGDKVTPIY